MSTSDTYAPVDGTFVGRPPCASCGASFHLHQPSGSVVDGKLRQRLFDGGTPLLCPQAARPDSLEAARRVLEDAEASGDAARIFAARGDVQRLEGRPHLALSKPERSGPLPPIDGELERAEAIDRAQQR